MLNNQPSIILYYSYIRGSSEEQGFSFACLGGEGGKEKEGIDSGDPSWVCSVCTLHIGVDSLRISFSDEASQTGLLLLSSSYKRPHAFFCLFSLILDTRAPSLPSLIHALGCLVILSHC